MLRGLSDSLDEQHLAVGRQRPEVIRQNDLNLVGRFPQRDHHGDHVVVEVRDLGPQVGGTVVGQHLLQSLDPSFEIAHELRELVERAQMRRLAQTLELGGDVDQFTLIAVAGWQDHGLGDLQRRQGLGVDVFAVAFHVDACQGGLYLPLLVHDLGVDLLTLDGSKIYGPKGTGVLYKKGGAFSGLPLSPVIFGGGQENGLRSGTENVPGIVGFGEALLIAHKEKSIEIVRLRILRDKMQAELLGKVKGLKVNGDVDKRLPNNLNICLPGLDAEYAVLRMDVLGFAISSVTSCKTLSEDSSSYVVEELYRDSSCSKSSLRITLGRFTTQKQINDLVKALLTVLHR